MAFHGEALRKLTNDPALPAALCRDPDGTDLPPRARALVDYALKLTRAPATLGPEDIAALRSAGLGDAGIHDLAAVTAYFAYVNRVALGLGVDESDHR